jgi:hypothetical protein
MYRVRLSDKFIVPRIISAVFLAVSIIVISIENEDFVEHRMWYLFILIFSFCLIYVWLMPKTFHDGTNMYIKRPFRQEIVVPINNIVSIKSVPSSYYRGYVSFKLKYFGPANQVKSTKFRVTERSTEVYRFIQIKNSNKKLELPANTTP